MSCCWSRKLFGRRSKREDRYKVKENEGEEAPKEEEQPPKFSWERREKVDPEKFLIKDQIDQVVKKEGEDGGPMQIENCLGSTIIFLHRSSQLIIDDCRQCTIVVGPSEGSVFIRDCHDCIVLTSCQQLRTRDCHNVRIGILCPTEPIVENSTDMNFYNLALFYPEFKDQLHAAGLRPFTNRVRSAHDFTPTGAGKNNFKVFVGPVGIPDATQAILTSNDVLLTSPEEFLPRFTLQADEDPTFLYVSGKAEPAGELSDKAIELLRSIYTAELKVLSTYDFLTKSMDAKVIPFAGKAERLILIQVSGNLAQLETDVEFDILGDEDALGNLMVHLEANKSG